MGVHISAPFTLDLWEATESEAPSEGPPTAVVRLAKTYTGEQLHGSAVGHALTTNGEFGASYVAQERITASLLGREGTFVLEHQASMGGDSAPVMSARIVAGSGTGALSGVWGHGELAHELLKLDINFD